jgi:glycosyltransferase involved in cell wall biosynthesis
MPSLARKVLFTGFVRDVKKIIKSSKIIFSCTGDKDFGESFSLAIVEAMMAGRAVIATEAGGSPEIIDDGINGFLVKPGDYKAMAKKALSLVNSKSGYDNIVNDARSITLEKYTMERFAKQIVEVL